MSEEVNKNNIIALHAGMNENRKRISDGVLADEQLNNRITMLQNEVTKLNSMVLMLLQKTSNGGSTSGD